MDARLEMTALEVTGGAQKAVLGMGRNALGNLWVKEGETAAGD